MNLKELDNTISKLKWLSAKLEEGLSRREESVMASQLRINDWYSTELGWTHPDFSDEYCSLKEAWEYQQQLGE